MASCPTMSPAVVAGSRIKCCSGGKGTKLHNWSLIGDIYHVLS